MTTVVRKDNESIEDALRRFKREVSKVGVLREARRHEHYQKPSEAKKLKKGGCGQEAETHLAGRFRGGPGKAHPGRSRYFDEKVATKCGWAHSGC